MQATQEKLKDLEGIYTKQGSYYINNDIKITWHTRKQGRDFLYLEKPYRAYISSLFILGGTDSLNFDFEGYFYHLSILDNEKIQIKRGKKKFGRG
jgi:hypothetical protein